MQYRTRTVVKSLALSGMVAATLALSGCGEPAPVAPAVAPAAPAAPAPAPAPVAPAPEVQGLTCELDQDAKTDANGMITNRACGDRPTGGGTNTAPVQDDGAPFVSGGNTDAPADTGPLPTYDPSQQTPQEYADQALSQLCADAVYADYEPCAAYR